MNANLFANGKMWTTHCCMQSCSPDMLAFLLAGVGLGFLMCFTLLSIYMIVVWRGRHG